ncbi:ABC transporter permease [Streptomyces sp. NBC_01718]|uniref:ABC transporter permease n=1 Tax=unclassified Streptomyces TaxID=2593676 RepID=UPI0030E23B85
MRTTLSSGKVRAGLAIFGVFLLLALIGPWLVEYVLRVDPQQVDYDALAQGPSLQHPLGTTTSGQDVLAQLISGCRGSVAVGLISGVLATFLAAAIGVTSGFLGGRTDSVLNAITNVFATLPGFPLTLIVAGYLTNTGSVVIALLIAVFEWPGGARYLRAQTLSLRSQDFSVALGMIGERKWRIITVEVMPHLTGILSAMFLRAIVAGIFAEAGLRFLGIGGGDTVTWGTMIDLANQQSGIMRGLWWWFAPPGVCIALIGMATALINFGVDEISNPSLRYSSRAATRRVAQHLRRRANHRTAQEAM